MPGADAPAGIWREADIYLIGPEERDALFGQRVRRQVHQTAEKQAHKGDLAGLYDFSRHAHAVLSKEVDRQQVET